MEQKITRGFSLFYASSQTRLWRIVAVFTVGLLAAVFLPDIIIDIGDGFFPDRSGIFINANHLNNFMMLVDGLFMALIVILVLSLLVALVLIFMSVRKTLRGFRKYRDYATVTQGPGFRVMVYVLLVLVLVFVGVAGLVKISCVDNEEIGEAATKLKFVSNDKNHMMETYNVARNFVEDKGMDWMNGVGIYLKDGYVFRTPGGGFMTVSNETMMNYNNKMYHVNANGTKTMMTMTDFKKNMGSYSMKTVKMENNEMVFTDTEPMYKYHDVMKVPMMDEKSAMNMLYKSGFTVEMMDEKNSEIMHYINRHKMEDSSYMDAVVKLAVVNNGSISSGLQLGYLTMMVRYYSKQAVLMNTKPEMLNLDYILKGVMWCDTGLMFAAVVQTVFMVLFILGAFVAAVTPSSFHNYIKTRTTPGNSYPQSAYQPVPSNQGIPLQDVQEPPVYDNVPSPSSSEWSSVTPMVATAATEFRSY